MNLFDIAQEYMTVLQMAEDPDVDPQTITDTMESIEADFSTKADSYAHIIAQLKADAAGIDTELKRLKARKESLENNADRLKLSLETAMRATGKTKFKTTLHSFGIQKNPASVVIDDEKLIPEDYLIPQAPKIDKAAIKDALKAGVDMSGIVHLEQTESLRIR